MVVNLLNKVKHDKELKCKAVKYIANKFQRTPGSITTKFSKSTKGIYIYIYYKTQNRIMYISNKTGNNNNNDNILMDEEHISNEYQMLYEIFEGFLPASYTEEYVKRMVTTKIKNKKNVNIITKYVMNIRQYVMDNYVDMDNIELYQEQIKVKVNNLNLENEQKKGLIQLVNDIPNKFGQDGDLHYFFIDTNIDEDIDVIIS